MSGGGVRSCSLACGVAPITVEEVAVYVEGGGRLRVDDLEPIVRGNADGADQRAAHAFGNGCAHRFGTVRTQRDPDERHGDPFGGYLADCRDAFSAR
jgi:hypothetical protein